MSSSKRVTPAKAVGGFVLLAAFAGMAEASDPATVLKRPAVGGLSDATKSRLKSAGLDAADPGLATKLQAKLRETEASFRGAHASSVRIAPKKPQLSSARSVSGGAPAGAASSAFAPTQGAGPGGLISPSQLPGLATFVDLYESGGRQVTSGPLDPARLKYVALFSSPKRISELPGGPAWGFNQSITYSGACGVNVREGARYVANASDVAFATGSYGHQLPLKAPANGKWYYYLEFSYGGLDLGASPHTVMLSVNLDALGMSSFSIPALSQMVTATITLTMDAAPPFVTNNSFGIGQSNGIFANPGATRLDPGTNPSASTTGDDKIGVGVNLGPGWSVTGAKIVAAHSVLDAPNDTTPDNSYRGAAVTQSPSSGRLQTTVHWHYGAAESLSYTIEWQLQGPGGQRPILTMPLGGPCDS